MTLMFKEGTIFSSSIFNFLLMRMSPILKICLLFVTQLILSLIHHLDMLKWSAQLTTIVWRVDIT